jgi:iron-sulfur cluster assembly accessory protein
MFTSRLRQTIASPSALARTTKLWSVAPRQILPRSMVMVAQHKAADAAPASTTDQQVNSTVAQHKATDAAVPSADEQLHITPSCWNRIHQLSSRDNSKQTSLRLFVDAGGCSGFSYKFELDEMIEPDDIVWTAPDDMPSARLVVDEGSLEYIRGSTIDYVTEMIKSSFEVKANPNSESACGCGSSFALKNFAANPALD